MREATLFSPKDYLSPGTFKIVPHELGLRGTSLTRTTKDDYWDEATHPLLFLLLSLTPDQPLHTHQRPI